MRKTVYITSLTIDLDFLLSIHDTAYLTRKSIKQSNLSKASGSTSESLAFSIFLRFIRLISRISPSGRGCPFFFIETCIFLCRALPPIRSLRSLTKFVTVQRLLCVSAPSPPVPHFFQKQYFFQMFHAFSVRA